MMTIKQYRDNLARDLAQAIAARLRIAQAIAQSKANGEPAELRTGLHYAAGQLAGDIKRLDKELTG